MQRRVLARLDELKRAVTIKFNFCDDGIKREGFLVHYKGQVLAYENACRHIPISLDYGDGEFFTRDGKHLYCQTHGAIYEPATGFCVQGPCAGASLKPVRVRVEDDSILLDQDED